MRRLLPFLLLFASCGGGGYDDDVDRAPHFATVAFQAPWNDYPTEDGGFGVKNFTPDTIIAVGWAVHSGAPISWLPTPMLLPGDDFEWGQDFPLGVVYVVARGTSGREYRALLSRVPGWSEGWTVTNGDLWIP